MLDAPFRVGTGPALPLLFGGGAGLPTAGTRVVAEDVLELGSLCP